MRAPSRPRRVRAPMCLPFVVFDAVNVGHAICVGWAQRAPQMCATEPRRSDSLAPAGANRAWCAGRGAAHAQTKYEGMTGKDHDHKASCPPCAGRRPRAASHHAVHGSAAAVGAAFAVAWSGSCAVRSCAGYSGARRSPSLWSTVGGRSACGGGCRAARSNSTSRRHG